MSIIRAQVGSLIRICSVRTIIFEQYLQATWNFHGGQVQVAAVPRILVLQESTRVTPSTHTHESELRATGRGLGVVAVGRRQPEREITCRVKEMGRYLDDT
jgi:hypothetical protein